MGEGRAGGRRGAKSDDVEKAWSSTAAIIQHSLRHNLFVDIKVRSCTKTKALPKKTVVYTVKINSF
jgi:hypothetical protein